MDNQFFAILSILVIPLSILAIIYLLSWWNIFAKAGQRGWKSFIPVYRTIIKLEIIGKPTWWIFLLFIPGVNFVIYILMLNNLSKSFGKGDGFTVGLVLLSFIFLPILAFGNARYIGPSGTQAFNLMV